MWERTSGIKGSWWAVAFAGMLVIGLGSGCDQSGYGLLTVNEFMAANDTVDVTGGSGEFPDWIELYNGGTEDIGLESYFITDDLGSPMTWQLPPLTVPSAGFILLIADGDNIDGGAEHLPFRLNADGEEIGLFYQDEEGTMLQVDAVAFGTMAPDESAARDPDGSENWVTTSNPTPGSSNSGS